MMRPRRTPAPVTVRVPAVTVTPVEPEPTEAPRVEAPHAAPTPAPETVHIDVVPTSESPAGADSTALIPYEAVTVPEARPSVMIVRSGGSDPYFHPRPKPLPQTHRRRAHWNQRLLFAGLILLGLIGIVPLKNALQAGGRYPAGTKLVNGQLVRSGPFILHSGYGPIGAGGGAAPGVSAPGSAGYPVSATPTGAPTTSPNPAPPPAQPTATPVPAPPPSDISPAPLSPWPPTNPWIFPKPGYYVAGADGLYPKDFGQCTWWALKVLADEGYILTSMLGLGNALDWAGDAQQQWRHLTVTSTPTPDSTVVFQPGVEGASGLGHVAHVIAVYPSGWFLVSEMNFYRKYPPAGWLTGGKGQVDYRYAYAGWGVSFILPPS